MQTKDHFLIDLYTIGLSVFAALRVPPETQDNVHVKALLYWLHFLRQRVCTLVAPQK